MLTVENIIDVMIEPNCELNFFIDGDTYKFNGDEVPEELLYMEVQSIDDPAFQMEGTPLTINLDEEGFDDLGAFKEEFKDYLNEYCY